MQISIDRYRARISRIHLLDPRVKVIAALLLIFTTVLLPDGAWVAFGLAWLVTLVLSTISGGSYHDYFYSARESCVSNSVG
jgi:energy-coupling factor transporter transmembrane protein EcfT